MAEDLIEKREVLYQMICSLKGEDIHKVASYVSFLRFVDVYKDKAMADLLRIEIAKSSQPKDELHDSLNDAVDAQALPALELPHENEETLDNETFVTDESAPESIELESAESISAEPEPIELESVSVEPEPVALESIELESVEPADETSVAETSLPEEEPPSQSVSVQKLRQIVKSLHLSFSDVAFLFHASLPRARMKYSGVVSFGAEEEMQLQYLLEVTERVEKMNIPRLNQMLKRPMPDGEFFLEKLKDRKVTDENLSILQETAERSEELRRKPKGATKPFHVVQNAIGLYATILHCEG